MFLATVEALVALLPASASDSSSTPASSWPVRSIMGLCRSGEDERSSCSLWRFDVSVPDSLRESWFCGSWTVVAFMPHEEKFFTFAVSLEGPRLTKSFLWKLPANAFTRKVLASPHHPYSREALGRKCWAGAIDLPRRFPHIAGATRRTTRLGDTYRALALGMHEASSQLPLPRENYWMPSDVLRDMEANVAAPETFFLKCPWCGRTGNGGYALEGINSLICTGGDYSCIWYQVMEQQLDREQFQKRAFEVVLTVRRVGQRVDYSRAFIAPDIVACISKFLYGQSCASNMAHNYVCAICNSNLGTQPARWLIWVKLEKETGNILGDSSGSCWLSKRVGKQFPNWKQSSKFTYADKDEDAICWAYVCSEDAGSRELHG